MSGSLERCLKIHQRNFTSIADEIISINIGVRELECRPTSINLYRRLNLMNVFLRSRPIKSTIWCWGRTFLAQGNWLIEQESHKAPEELERAKNIYSLKISKEIHKINGFGIIFTDNLYGRYLFQKQLLPKYAASSKIEYFTLEYLIIYQNLSHQKKSKNNIAQYQFNLSIGSLLTNRISLKNLGIDFRNTIVDEWNIKKRQIIASDNIISEWENFNRCHIEMMQL